MRFDLQIIASWIEPGAKVLDLGCGHGELLSFLVENRRVSATGIERDEAKVVQGIECGLTILQGDINQEVLDYADQTFDYVVLSQTLQQVLDPARLIREILRIGRKGIVSFPNFAHWPLRLQLFFKGLAPITPALPYQWYDTPNIRLITIEDFRKFSKDVGFGILKEVAITSDHHADTGRIVALMPNLFAAYCLFLIGRGKNNG